VSASRARVLTPLAAPSDPAPGGLGLQRIGSVVIPAHNEAAAIRRCLDALFSGIDPGELDVVVVCNGCTDATAELARGSGYPVRVLELARGSKPAALRAGDLAALGFPRIYLDADVLLHGSAARRLCERLRAGAVAVRPPIDYDADRSTRLVHHYYRARTRIPAVHRALWGAGVYGLSEAGRSRFEEYPDLTGDDLWVDRHFARGEVEVISCRPVRVVAPRRAADLLRVLRRTYRGKGESMPAFRTEGQVSGTTSSTVGDLVRLVATRPTSTLDAVVYGGFALAGRVALKTAGDGGSGWERDESSRGA
jgi:glycosyltransferase involved in cell wall biosynthesis